MFKNYIKSAFRNISKHPFSSIINIGGLVIGMIAFILIALFIENEISYDGHLKNYDNIYRLTGDMTWASGAKEETALAPPAIAGYLKSRLPEIKQIVRLGFPGRVVVEHENNQFIEEGFLYADSSFFEIFDFELLRGNSTEILKSENNIIITQEIRKKYFGDNNPLGKVLKINGNQSYIVSGIIKEIPSNSHFTFDILAPMPNERYRPNDWFNMSTATYVLFQSEIQPTDIEQKIFNFIKADFSNYHEIISFRLQHISQIHLHNDRMYDYSDTTQISTLYLFGAIALFILIVACINFMNLSTARFAYRFKEVGIRKVSGAQRTSIIQQFIWESIIIVFIAMIHAIVFLEILLPYFSGFMEKDLNLSFIDHTIKIILLGIVIGLFGGSYPALYYSSIQPIKALKGTFIKGKSNYQLRKGLVIIQFVITSVLLISTFIIFQQYQYLKTKELGFDKEDIICLYFENQETVNKIDLLKNELLSEPTIEQISISNTAPSHIITEDHFRPEGFDNHIPLKAAYIDEDYIPLLNIQVLEGRNFDPTMATDSNAFIINEAALKNFGWELDDVLDKTITWSIFENETKARVIGLVKDFHYESLHEEIDPLIIRLAPREDFWQTMMSIKFNRINYDAVLKILEKKWNEFEPTYPFEYSLLSEDYEKLYENEKKLGTLVLLFTLLAIIIACLGLVGLTNFMTDKRTKEIGIRKTFGANSTKIIWALSNEFTYLILIANIIAWPFAYYFSQEFMQNFAYQKTVSVWIFIIATIITILITLLTILYQSYKIAVKNPTESLRYE